MTIFEKEMSERTKIIIIGSILLLIAIVSFFVIAKYASSEATFTGVYSALDEKKSNVLELMGVTAASSAAISLLPGDAGTPIAEQLADMSSYFMIILAAICLEKWMVTITGALAFRILIPVSCLILLIARACSWEAWRSVGIKLILFAIAMFCIIPVSGIATEKIDASYQASVKQTIEDTKADAEKIRETVGNEKDDNVVEQLFNKVKGGVAGQLDKFEKTVNRITEAIAVLIVTSCVIPIAVIIFFLWLIRLLTGVNIQVPEGMRTRRGLK